MVAVQVARACSSFGDCTSLRVAADDAALEVLDRLQFLRGLHFIEGKRHLVVVLRDLRLAVPSGTALH